MHPWPSLSPLWTELALGQIGFIGRVVIRIGNMQAPLSLRVSLL
jgi:hypothetical protein